MDLTESPHLSNAVRTDAEWLAAHWMPFTANRQYKAAPRLLASAQGMYYKDVDGNTVLCRLYYRDDANVEEAAELVEDAFRISASAPEDRELILEVVS